MKTKAALAMAFGFFTAIGAEAFATSDHLLLTEATLTPTSGEYLEIYNPTASPIALDNYYLSDTSEYALLPGASGAGPAPSVAASDFIVQFPPASTIAAGEVLTIAFDGAGFNTDYGIDADFEIAGTSVTVPDMVGTYVSGSQGLTNSGESAVLFFWDGASDLVQDVDAVNLGTPSSSNQIASKTGITVDGPDVDTTASAYATDLATMPIQASDPGFGFSTKRIFLEGSEVTGSGNGLTGDDETSEDITVTWDSTYSAPDPGTISGTLVEPSTSTEGWKLLD